MDWECFWCGDRLPLDSPKPADRPDGSDWELAPNCARCSTAAYGSTRESTAVPMLRTLSRSARPVTPDDGQRRSA